MLKRILMYGLAAGAIVGVPMGLIAFQPDHEPGTGSLIQGYATMLLALSMVFLGIKRHRDLAQGGVIKFLPALGMGLAISAVAGVIYVLAWEAAMALSHADFAGDYASAVIAQQQARGASAEDLARLRAEMEQFKVNYANPLFRLPMTFIEIFPVGVLVSLVSAALLRNSRFLPARRETPKAA